MGYLEDGVWIEADFGAYLKDGRMKRPPTKFHQKITKDGSSGFPPVAGRYHLYVSYACPWAHRTLIVRKLKNLESAISVSVVSPLWLNDGWTFEEYPGSTPDSVNNFKFLREAYTTSKADYSGTVTVPVLWDKETKQIVNNESYEIALMMQEAFDSPGTPDLYPTELRDEIEKVNDTIYHKVNNGVYKAGAAILQDDYETHANGLFNCLDELDERLGQHRYLVGNTFTLADVRLFVTLLRFDPVYFVHFKCCKRMISTYPNLSNYIRDIYQMPGIAETVNWDHIRTHYYRSHIRINPFGIVPIGPIMDHTLPHDRDRFEAKRKRRGRNIDAGAQKKTAK